ncbi:MAG: hypothetical protein Q9186_007612, partial [Xanthomendoza sp. 1 TL-2023]
MAAAITKSDAPRKALTEINLLLENGYIHAILGTFPSVRLLEAPAEHLAASNLSIWLHVPDRETSAADDMQSMAPNEWSTKLHHAGLEFEKAWNETGTMRLRITKMASKVEKWYARHRICAEELSVWDGKYGGDEKIKHIQGIEAQKQYIRSLATPLQELQRQHYIQESDKSVEKVKAIACTKVTPYTKAILHKTTYFSSGKPGHEDGEEAIIPEKVMEFITAGIKLETMISMQSRMDARLKKATSKFAAAAARFQKAGTRYNKMRIDCHQKMLLLEKCFHAVGQTDNFVSAALETLEEVKVLYGQESKKGYWWALEQ